MNTDVKFFLVTLSLLLIVNSSMAGRYHERHRDRGLLGLGLDLLGVRPAYGYGGGYGNGYGQGYGHRPVVSTTSYYGYPAYGSGYGNGYGSGYGSGYGHGGYGNQGYGYLDRPGYGGHGYDGHGYDGYGHGRAPIRVKTVIKSKHDW